MSVKSRINGLFFIYQAFHEELLSKEGRVATLKAKAQQLIHNKEHVPGMRDVKKSLRKLGTSIMVSYDGSYNATWIAQIMDIIL